MEVHAHSHTARKKWTHYFWEFLMLFLAVFCGFFAEYQLEHKIEKDREKEYAGALYDELLEDSVSFSNKMKARSEKEKDCDYLWSYIKDSSLTDLPKAFYPAYTTVFYLINSYTFEPKDGILSQLKSSGSLRYFKSTVLQKLFGDISANILNLKTFDRGEAANMIMFYKTMLLSTRTLQMNDYITANKKLLQELRKKYHLK